MHAILFLIIIYDNSICYKDSPVILPIGGITIQKKNHTLYVQMQKAMVQILYI